MLSSQRQKMCLVLLFLVILAVLVLPVGLRFVVVTDSEFRAAVETAETQCAPLCRPDRVLAEFVGLGLVYFLHFDSLHRTFLGA